MHGRLVVKDRIKSYVQLPDVKCGLCGVVTETVDHLFFQCDLAKTLLCTIMKAVGIYANHLHLDWWSSCFSAAHRKASLVFQLRAATFNEVIYGVWQLRNAHVFQGIAPDVVRVGKMVAHVLLVLLKRKFGAGNRILRGVYSKLATV